MQLAQAQAEAAGASHEEAPPKQVALAMERLSHAGRLIADIRLGGDRLLEALSVAAQPHRSNKPLNFIMEEDASMRKLLQELRDVGKQLEESGVLSGSLRSRSNSWGLHMPLVCPDGAVVAYAWKRQLAGQAGASAVDRTRLALKAFTDQKRRFFPHLDIESSTQISGGESGISKRHCSPQASGTSNNEELIELTTLSGVLTCLEKEVPTVKINTYQRLDWLKRASLLSLLSNEDTLETSSKDNVHNSNRLLTGPSGTAPVAQAAVIELLVPSIFRAIVSLHPAGSTEPDAVAFFSPDEGGNYVHARGFSVYHVFRQITEHAVKALQYFVATKPDRGLYLLLQWVCSYQTLFSKACGKCHRLLTIDRPSALLLPPVHRPFRYPTALKILSNQSTQSTRDHSLSLTEACHIGCSLEES